MKLKLMFPLLIIMSLVLGNLSCTPKMSYQASAYNTSVEKAVDDPGKYDPLLLNEVNAKVLRNFYSKYGEMPAAKWYRSGNGFRVVFVNNEITYSVYYKQNGLEDASILSYTENRLPARVRHLVKSGFYDYTISHVKEVHKNGAVAFYVKLEDATVIRTLKIVEEEWEEVESIIKR